MQCGQIMIRTPQRMRNDVIPPRRSVLTEPRMFTPVQADFGLQPRIHDGTAGHSHTVQCYGTCIRRNA